MEKKRWTKLFLAGFTAFSLVTTSLGGAFATAALAATPEEGAQQAGSGVAADNKAVVGGLLALGLITMLAKGGDGGDSAAPPGKTPAPAPQPNPQPQPAPSPSPAPSGVTADEQRAFELLNADRIANGLKPLKLNRSIVAVAEAHAQDMINRNFFAHQNPDGLSPFDRMRRAGISFGYAGENLAINSSVDGAERAFMNSPGHRANILNPNYTEVGIGIRYSPKGSLYLVQNFIGR